MFGRNASDLVAENHLAVLAGAHLRRARARPAVGEESVHGIERSDLAIDGGHLLGEIGAEHAGLVEPGAFLVGARGAVRVALEPFRVRAQGLGIRKVAVHARDHAQAALLCRRDHLAEQVPRAKILAAVVKGHARGVERHDASAVQEHSVNFQRCPVIHPGVGVQG